MHRKKICSFIILCTLCCFFSFSKSNLKSPLSETDFISLIENYTSLKGKNISVKDVPNVINKLLAFDYVHGIDKLSTSFKLAADYLDKNKVSEYNALVHNINDKLELLQNILIDISYVSIVLFEEQKKTLDTSLKPKNNGGSIVDNYDDLYEACISMAEFYKMAPKIDNLNMSIDMLNDTVERFNKR